MSAFTRRGRLLRRAGVGFLVATVLTPSALLGPITVPATGASVVTTYYVGYGLYNLSAPVGSSSCDYPDQIVGSGPGFMTFADAISSAIALSQADATNSVLHVCAGTYVLDVSLVLNDAGSDYLSGGYTTRIEGDGSAATTITASGLTASAFDLEVYPVTFADLAITGGNAVSPVYGSFGGAILSRPDLVLESVDLSGNYAKANGGAVYVGGAASGPGKVTITGSSFTDNSAGVSGGAVYATGSVEVDGSTFLGNGAPQYGGAIHVGGGGEPIGRATITNSAFANNSAGYSGGAVYATGSAEIRGSTFLGNGASIDGGAAYVGGGGETVGSVAITASAFVDNTAGNWGGAVASLGYSSLFSDPAFPPQPVVVDVSGGTFQGNSAQKDGGAIFANAPVYTNGTDFTDNTAGTIGGAIRSNLVSTTDGTFSGNTAASESGGAIYAYYAARANGSTFDANEAALAGGAIFGGAGTVTTTNAAFTGNRAGLAGGAVAAGRFVGYGTPAGTVSIHGGQFIGNQMLGAPPDAWGGGAVYAEVSVEVDGGLFQGNLASPFGGAISAYSSADPVGTITVTEGTFIDNTADTGVTIGAGGGALRAQASATVTGSTFRGNTITGLGAVGGAIFASDGATVLRSVLARNTAATSGGGIYVEGSVTATNSTFVENSAGTDGSALRARTGATLRNVTVAGNAGPYAVLGGSLGALDVANTIFGTADDECSGWTGITDRGGNIDVSAVASGCIDPANAPAGHPSMTTGDSADLDLGPLQANGGPTETMALGPASIARDYGVDTVCADTTDATSVNGVDQRGEIRPKGAHCDSGAFEATPLPAKTIYIEEHGASCAAPEYRTIQDAVDAATPGQTVHLCAGTYDLSSGSATPGPVILNLKVLTIRGDSSTNTILDGGGDTQLIATTLSIVTLKDLTLRRGYAANPAGGGGAVAGSGPLAIERVRFIGNRAAGAGGAITAAGPLTVTGSAFTDNTAGSSGGAIAASGPMSATASTFTDNSAGSSGGAVDALYATITRSSFARNAAVGNGGATQIRGPSTISESTFVGNTAGSNGGAVIADGTLTVANATFVGNRTTRDSGGAVYANSPLQVKYATFVDNTAGDDTGHAIITGSAIRFDHVLFAGSAVNCQFGNSYQPIDDGGTIDTGGTCLPPSPGTGSAYVARSSLKLGSLSDNSGGTETIPLGNGSVAIDTTSGPCSLGTDQRGTSRPQGSGCDSGAYEAVGGYRNNTLTVDATTGGSITATGIDCGSDCTEDYSAGSIVVLTATPDAGYVLGEWTRDCVGQVGGTCALTMSAGRHAGALFTLEPPTDVPTTLTLTSDLTTATYGDRITFSADVVETPDLSPAGRFGTLASPSGTVSFSDGSGWTASCELTSGSCSVSTGDFHAGTHHVTAGYGGDAAYAASSDALDLTVGTATLTVSPSDKSIAAGSSAPSAGFYTFGVTGWKRGENAETAQGYGAPTCGSGYTPATSPGTLAITCGASPDGSAGTADDYAFSYGTATLTVTAVSLALTFTGPAIVYTPGADATVSLSARYAPAIAGCPLTFALDPSTGVSPGGPYTVVTAASGVATTAGIAMPIGVYGVTVTAGGACAGTDTGEVTIAPATLASGTTAGGSYRSPQVSPAKIHAGYVVRRTDLETDRKTGAVTTTWKGQLHWVVKAGWRLKSNWTAKRTTLPGGPTSGLTTWAVGACPATYGSATLGPTYRCGTFTGTGLLETWDRTLNRGLGGWKPSRYETVTFVVTVFDGGSTTVCKSGRGGKTCPPIELPDYFGISLFSSTGAEITSGPPVGRPVVLSGQIRIY